MSCIAVPAILATLVGRIAAAVPARARTTFLELLLGAAATKSGHVTDAILASGLSRGWSTYYWFLEAGTLVLAAGLGRLARSADDAVPPGGLVGVTTRSVQNRTLSRKPSKFRGFHKRSSMN